MTALQVIAPWPSVPVRNTSTTARAGAAHGWQTGKTWRICQTLKGTRGPFTTRHLDSKHFINAAAAAGPT